MQLFWVYCCHTLEPARHTVPANSAACCSTSIISHQCIHQVMHRCPHVAQATYDQHLLVPNASSSAHLHPVLHCVCLQIIDAVPKQPNTTFLVLVMKRCSPADSASPSSRLILLPECMLAAAGCNLFMAHKPTLFSIHMLPCDVCSFLQSCSGLAVAERHM